MWLESFTQLLSAGGWAGLENSTRLHSHSGPSVHLHLFLSMKLRLPHSMVGLGIVGLLHGTWFPRGNIPKGAKVEAAALVRPNFETYTASFLPHSMGQSQGQGQPRFKQGK